MVSAQFKTYDPGSGGPDANQEQADLAWKSAWAIGPQAIRNPLESQRE
jgi:hypothetical protein